MDRAVARLILRGGVLLTVASLIAAAPLSPERHFGHPMGSDRKLLDWNKVVSYFEQLENSSDRIRIEKIGNSTEGRQMIAAFIASPQTLANLDKYRLIQSQLADPRGLPEAAAEAAIANGKTIVMITCSIHSSEVQSTSTAVQFAYNLLTQERPEFRTILDNTILILVPSLNPDGVDIVTRWYRRTLGTPYEGTSPPELYHKYVGHDNNRDWYIHSQRETQNVISKLHNVWHPQIVYDVHQQSAYASRIFVPPWLDPIEPNVDPIIAQLANSLGAGIAADLTLAGKTGVSINSSYDFWTPARHYQSYHGGVRILSESASARLATPINVAESELTQTALGYSPRERSWNHLQPWLGGEWRVRDIMDYQLIAFESCLYQAAVRRQDLLRGFLRIGQRAIARTSPYAFVVPAQQRDPGSTKAMLDTLLSGQVEIRRASAPFKAAGKEYSAGSYVVLLQQPYGSYAKTLLERQDYPDIRMYPGGPPRRPYDVTAHTLPMLMGVQVDTIAGQFPANLNIVNAIPASQSLSAGNVEAWRVINDAWREGRQIWRHSDTGDFSLSPANGAKPLKQPRVALYKSHMPSMDEGWTRWLLEKFRFSYTSVGNEEILRNNLRARYDAIILPDQGPGAIHNGYRPGTMPEEYTGGLGEQGAQALKQFVAQGGTLVCLNDSTAYAIGHLGVGAKNGVRGLSSREYYSPGSLLNVKLDAGHPLTYGLPAEIQIWSEQSPAFEPAQGQRAVATYPDANILASGWLLGDKHLQGRAALLDIPTGTGRVILFGMRPQYRAQSYQTFKMFFNALVLN